MGSRRVSCSAGSWNWRRRHRCSWQSRSQTRSRANRAGSTGSALRAVRPPNLHIRPAVRRDLVYAASATAVTFVGRRANNAVSQGRCLTSALVRENPQLRRHEDITGRHTMYCPPFTVRVDPVMKPASSVARKTTLRAISSGSPRRLSGINGRMLFSSTSFGTACTISVLM
jgi:hypothetical protein